MKRDTEAQKWDTPNQAHDFIAFSGEKQGSGEPDRIRTCDPLIKSQLLYQLSYRPHAAAQ